MWKGDFFLSSGYYPSKSSTPLTLKEFDFALVRLCCYNDNCGGIIWLIVTA